MNAYLGRIIGVNRGARLEAKLRTEFCAFLAAVNKSNLNPVFIFSKASKTVSSIALNFTRARCTDHGTSR